MLHKFSRQLTARSKISQVISGIQKTCLGRPIKPKAGPIVESDFDGFWFIDTRTTISTSWNAIFLVIDTENSLFSAYPGEIDYVRQPNPDDLNPINTPAVYTFDTLTTTLTIDLVPGYRFSLNADKDTLYGDGTTDLGDDFVLQHVIFHRQSQFPPTLIQNIERPQEVDWNRPDLILRYYLDGLNRTYEAFTPYDVSDGLSKYNESYAALNDYISGNGRVYSANIVKIYKSNKVGVDFYKNGSGLYPPLPVPAYPVTLIELDQNPFTPGSKIKIEGLSGDWKKLNGEWDSDIGIFSNMRVPPQFVNPKNLRYIISIPVDTSNLHKFKKKCQKGKIIAHNKPVKSDSEYFDLVVASVDILQILIDVFHTWVFPYVYVDPQNGIPRYPKTFTELSFLLNDPVQSQYVIKYFSTTVGNGPSATSFYAGPVNSLVGFTQVFWDWSNQANKDPYDPKYANPPYLNYLNPATISQLYTSNDGNALTVVVAPRNSTPPGFQPLENVIYNIPPPVFGVFKNGFVPGRKVGYINLIGYVAIDQDFAALDLTFPANLPPHPPYYTLMQIIATMMKWFATDQNVDDLIIDQRINYGGFGEQLQALGASLGALRAGFDTIMASVGSPLRPSFNQFNSFDSTVPLNTNSIYNTIDPALPESIVPGSNFVGSSTRRRNIILLDSTNAGSAAQIFPSYIIGDSLDGNLGGNVRAYILGSIDNRYTGDQSSAFLEPPLNFQSPILSVGSVPTPVISNSADNWATFQHNAVTPYNLAKWHNFFIPKVKIDYRFCTIYPDIGLCNSKRKYRIGTPNFNNPTTYADTPLEISLDYLTNLN
jgi:hypothetical protein